MKRFTVAVTKRHHCVSLPHIRTSLTITCQTTDIDTQTDPAGSSDMRGQPTRVPAPEAKQRTLRIHIRPRQDRYRDPPRCRLSP